MAQLPSNHRTTIVNSTPLEEFGSDHDVTLALQKRGYEWQEHEHILILEKKLPEIENGVLRVMQLRSVPPDQLSQWAIRLEEDVDRATHAEPNKAAVTEELKDLFDLSQSHFIAGLWSHAKDTEK
jgi:hypothetical protein